ncbi:hypothetical protein J7L84_03830 [Candidatus Bipolaricaulota bacterium]|nr:hypothetical protein [Candidatus Bipolaricaulota bacterium]
MRAVRWLHVAAFIAVGSVALAGGFGGPGAAFLFWDLSSLNDALAAAGYPTLDGNFLLYGGIGAGGDGTLFGGGGFGGSMRAVAGDRSAEVSLGFGAALAEIEVTERERLEAAVGALFGGGSVDLILHSRSYSGFEDALSNPGDLYLSRGFFSFLPYVSAAFRPLEWLGVRVMLGYLLTFPGPWEEGGTELPGPPRTFGGPYLGICIVFGSS